MDYLRKNLKKIAQNKAFQPLFLLIIAALSYGLFIREVGLYWDDFPYTWFGHVLGPTQYHKVFYDERPFLAPLYNITASIFGESIISWQIFAIILRWLCALCAGWLVRLMWNDKYEEAFVVSLLFLVYPGLVNNGFLPFTAGSLSCLDCFYYRWYSWSKRFGTSEDFGYSLLYPFHLARYQSLAQNTFLVWNYHAQLFSG